MKSTISDDGKKLVIHHAFSEATREVTIPEDRTTVTVSRWLLDQVCSSLLHYAHPQVKVRPKTEDALREELMRIADGCLKTRDLLQPFTRPPAPGVGWPAVDDLTCALAINDYIVEQAVERGDP